MKYTRYNYKPPRKNNNFMLIIILTLIAAIILGTIISKLLIKNNSLKGLTNDKKSEINLEKETDSTNSDVKDSTLKEDKTNDSKVVEEVRVEAYDAIQCGVFQKKENAVFLKNSLVKLGTPFIIEENNMNKVILGIYPQKDADIIIEKLIENKIDFTKTSFKLNVKDVASAQINEMISANLKILNKLSEKETKAVQTGELKKWAEALTGAENKSEDYNRMTEIKTYILGLPEEIQKDKAEEGYIYIYKFMKKN